MTKTSLTLTICGGLCASLLAAACQAADIQPLLRSYQQQGAAGPFSADTGGRLWTTAGDSQRKCSSCHGEDLRQPGKQATTGKPIEPLAPSALAERLTESAKVEKWLKRNCKWTFGRECSPQEKGDLISFINSR
ncbi:MAG: DUF1924 domain-containing protein [Gammaproteobacteria bacterium SHHR-1]|uniref:DUF1924 domain-containing protein n=1 Tax=Magnetovirga frankeli TaxID=947516 RepID=UPI00129383F1|nr:DUF1924 domain-containing protein [gamma proteobacterium SS-5]